MKKEYKIVTHGNIELLEEKINTALEHGWNILGYPRVCEMVDGFKPLREHRSD